MAHHVYKFHIGIDVSKARLDVSFSNESDLFQCTNDERGVKELIKLLPSKKRCLIILEATGGYEKLAATYLRQKGWNVAVVNAKRIRDFAKASGKFAKTDKIDAQTIMLFGKTFNPEPQALASKEEAKRSYQLRRREQLVRMIAMEKQHLEHAPACGQKSMVKHIHFLEKEVEAIEQQLKEGLYNDIELKDRMERLQEIKGVGEMTAMNILIHLPEIGTLSTKEVSALAGVAPFNKDSGQSKGKRETQGGRPAVKKALYMAILSARKYNPIIKKFYDRLIEKGKLKKVAIVACMRKLIVIINAILKNNTRWMNGPTNEPIG